MCAPPDTVALTGRCSMVRTCSVEHAADTDALTALTRDGPRQRMEQRTSCSVTARSAHRDVNPC
jgi:hypothetical protein